MKQCLNKLFCNKRIHTHRQMLNTSSNPFSRILQPHPRPASFAPRPAITLAAGAGASDGSGLEVHPCLLSLNPTPYLTPHPSVCLSLPPSVRSSDFLVRQSRSVLMLKFPSGSTASSNIPHSPCNMGYVAFQCQSFRYSVQVFGLNNSLKVSNPCAHSCIPPLRPCQLFAFPFFISICNG